MSLVDDGRASEVASAVTKAGGLGTAVFAGMTAQEFAAIGGLTITLLAFVVSLWYQHKRFNLMKQKARDEKEAREQHLEIDRLRFGQPAPGPHDDKPS